MDRRNSHIDVTKFNSPQKCIHTKNIYSLLDLGHSEESYIKNKKHVDSCQICKEALKNFEQENIEIKIHIPKPQIDTETKLVFSREVSDLFEAFDLNEKSLLRKKIVTKIKKMDTFGISVINNFVSKKMMATYAFGAVLFVVLKRFFN